MSSFTSTYFHQQPLDIGDRNILIKIAFRTIFIIILLKINAPLRNPNMPKPLVLKDGEVTPAPSSFN